MKQNNLSLLFKFTLFLSLLLIGTSIFLSLANVSIEWFRTKAELKDKGYSLAQNLAFNCEYGILSDNREELNRLVKNLMEEKDVSYVQILNDKNTVLAQGRKSGKADLDITVPVKSVKIERSPEEIGLSPLSSLGKPDAAGKEVMVGKVKVGISITQAAAAVRELLTITISVTLLVILAGLGGIAFLSRFLLIIPLQQLVAGTQKIAQGDFSHRIEINSRDEIGELAASFNQMTVQLEKAQKELANYARGLEDKVAERTRELELAKTGLEQKVSERTAELEKERASLENKVAERTKELREKVTELEEFYTVAVGRELKLIDHEKEVDALLKELGRPSKYYN
jgi:methyl-accepting chemotaxis protein